MEAKKFPADIAPVCSCNESSDQRLVKHIEELNRKQQTIYPLINRLRKRIELQRRFVTRIGVQD